tara:strand:+ start:1093 stop:1539 length:447 start_codon:yes stop_codon:yes gene_type:complete
MGFSIAVIAKAVGCSRDTVPAVLDRAGVARRRAGRVMVPAVARELLQDLKGHFGGRATEADIADWLGLSDTALSAALIALELSGLVVRSGRAIVPGARTGSRRRHSDRDDRIMEMRHRGATYINIAKSLGLTMGMVSGAVCRARRAAA